MKAQKLILGIVFSLLYLLFLTGSGQQADVRPEPRFPQELVSMLEEAFIEKGWRGVQEMLETGGRMSAAEGSQIGQENGWSGEESGQSGQENGWFGLEGAQSGLENTQSGTDNGQSGEDGVQPAWNCVDMLVESELFQHFPLINEYKDRMIYEYEPYDAVSWLYHGPKNIIFIIFRRWTGETML